MAIEDVVKNGVARGFVLGVGAALLVPAAAALLSGSGRPLARAAIKTGMTLLEKGRETAAEVHEIVEDLVAEAREELDEDMVAARGADTEATAAAAASPDGADASEENPESSSPKTAAKAPPKRKAAAKKKSVKSHDGG